MRVYKKLFDKIINPENLFLAWEEFKIGKTKKADVADFEKNLEQNIFQLHRDLRDKTYKHGGYASFYIYDPKNRHIHKATVRDRVLHHAIFNILNPVFEPTFIPYSFSCRIGKGNHKGVWAIENFVRKVSKNYTDPCYALKCDIKKFFDTIDHFVLIAILKEKIGNKDVLWLLEEIIEGFTSRYSDLFNRKGIPIGNLTSQLFANVYMNRFDRFIKEKIKAKFYGRYTDDFIVLSESKEYLEKIKKPIKNFLEKELKLVLHPDKVSIIKYFHGIDFLGYVVFPHYCLVRKRTVKRIIRKLKSKIKDFKANTTTKESLDQSLNSFLGVLSHANTHKLKENIINKYWFWINE